MSSSAGSPPIADYSGDTSDTLDLRIAAIFVIFAAAMLGGCPPLFINSFRNASNPVTLIFRALAAGVILALALIHVIGDGESDLSGISDYPISGACILFGVLLMVVLENLSHFFMASSKGGGAHAHHLPHPTPAGDNSFTKLSSKSVVAAINDVNKGERADDEPPVDLPECSAAAQDGHTHSCIAANTAANCWASQQSALLSTQAQATIREQITAYMFELGCVVHSFIIGLTLGVTVDGRAQALALFIALIFHQGLEAIGLGSVLVLARFSVRKSLIMVVSYALTTPLGVAVGIGIASTYDPSSVTALAVQGVFNSVSGGLLLYISLVQLIAEDFSRMDVHQPRGLSFRLASYAALAAGSGCMAMLAIWA